jgi:hypothetical protein
LAHWLENNPTFKDKERFIRNALASQGYVSEGINEAYTEGAEEWPVGPFVTVNVTNEKGKGAKTFVDIKHNHVLLRHVEAKLSFNDDGDLVVSMNGKTAKVIEHLDEIKSVFRDMSKAIDSAIKHLK